MHFKITKKKIIIAAVVVIAVACGIFTYTRVKAAKPAAAKAETTAQVAKGNIKVEISGSGVIEPLESYDITPLVNGKIIEAPFELGDKVKKDDILYMIDAAEIEGNIKKTQNSLSKLDLSTNEAQKSIDKTTVYAGKSGRLTNFTVKENENITSSKLGDIVDDRTCIAKVPFSEAQVNQIYEGEAATLNSPVLMSSISGTVQKIDSYSAKKSGGVVLYDVEIAIDGSNSLIKDTDVTAIIGSMESPEAGKLSAPEAYTQTASVTGKVQKVYVSNNDYVVEGQKLLEFDRDTYNSTISKNSLDRNDYLITLDTQKRQLDNYNIKSPIDGTVLIKNKKAGDTIGASANTQTLMTVVDMTKVKFDMKIDELDINKLKINQAVNVTADAIPDKVFVGKITSIAGKGTATNGVSNYLVQVTIDDPEGLKPGMNVSAKTIVAEKENILMVPASAVWKKDGKTYVTLPSGDGKETPGTEKKEVNVEIGINNKDYIEITKGLNEGDKVVIPSLVETNKTSANDDFNLD
jgi:RND family efflux transporter, MFP subunit